MNIPLRPPIFRLLKAALCVAAFAAALQLGAPRAAYSGQGVQLHESEIKAGLLYNFLKYVEWPPDMMPGKAPITVCVFGSDTFGGHLQTLKDLTVQARAITVKQVRGADDAAACHLLFVSADEKSAWPDLARALDGKNVLTVSDFSGFAAAGGMVEFTSAGSHIGADLNMTALNAAKLHIGDRLLRLVKVVHYPRPGGSGQE